MDDQENNGVNMSTSTRGEEEGESTRKNSRNHKTHHRTAAAAGKKNNADRTHLELGMDMYDDDDHNNHDDASQQQHQQEKEEENDGLSQKRAPANNKKSRNTANSLEMGGDGHRRRRSRLDVNDDSLDSRRKIHAKDIPPPRYGFFLVLAVWGALIYYIKTKPTTKVISAWIKWVEDAVASSSSTITTSSLASTSTPSLFSSSRSITGNTRIPAHNLSR